MSANDSTGDTRFDVERVRHQIVEAATVEAGLSTAVANDAAFHLTDWLGDLYDFVEFCKAPESHTPEEVNDVLLALLIHAPNHLAAAAKLYADLQVADIFNVGAVAERQD